MPPITRIKKQDIIEQAYLIVKEEGLEKLNARAVAKRLGCSIQPIFHNFSTMEELKREVMGKVIGVYRSYINSAHSYKEMGLAYIQFAKEDTKLFQLLFMNPSQQDAITFMYSDQSFQDIIQCIEKVTGFNEEQASQLHLKVWIFTHGLATMLVTHTCEFTDEQISNLLTDIFLALYQKEKDKGESIDE